MNRYAKLTPEGTRDLLFEECTARRDVEKRLTALFAGMGYQEVQTPGIEFFDVFRQESGGFPAERMFKLTDYKGRLLVLRPDSTMPIARMVSTRLKGAAVPIRLFYNQKVYRSNPSFSGHSDEVLQVGVELIGSGGKRADLEVISAAVGAMRACMPGFCIELGHAGFFSAVSEQLGANQELLEDIRSSIESKNYAALDAQLDTLEDSPAVRAMRRLPRLFGGEEVLEEAAALCGGEVPTQALSYLRELYEKLSCLGLGSQLSIDLGLVHRNEYYTGMIFRGYLPGSGETVLSGGRYDNLLGRYGTPMPAAGFGVDVDAVAKLMVETGENRPGRAIDVLVHGCDGYEMQALLRQASLVARGVSCEASAFATVEEAEAHARARGIGRLDIVGDSVETRTL